MWGAAEALRRAEGDLTSEAEAIGSAPEDAAMIDEVEARHNAVEQAADQFERTRKRTFWIGGACALATIPGVAAAGSEGLLFVGLAVVSVVASLLARAKVGRAAKAEEQALAEAGASSYLGFQLQRVNGLLANDTSRKALMDVAGARRLALAEWQQLAGDIPVEWALANREEIQEASRLRREVDALGSISSTAPDVPNDVTGELAHVLVTRLAEVRAVGGEGMPLLLDDPFQQLDPSVKPLLLELLGRSAGEPQIVFLTEDEDVASWARLEALEQERLHRRVQLLAEVAADRAIRRLSEHRVAEVALRILVPPPVPDVHPHERRRLVPPRLEQRHEAVGLLAMIWRLLPFSFFVYLK